MTPLWLPLATLAAGTLIGWAPAKWRYGKQLAAQWAKAEMWMATLRIQLAAEQTAKEAALADTAKLLTNFDAHLQDYARIGAQLAAARREVDAAAAARDCCLEELAAVRERFQAVWERPRGDGGKFVKREVVG